ncbi:hypothetical protein [Ligilactobacillus saerimneri]|uniref:hypothetical protein n=1 Tax=Ligilactobacillus saerimneri TaxID=228229 RepID=UPI0024BA04A6|nr:hypothetical protein [Ligilactobacillus saerimneri]
MDINMDMKFEIKTNDIYIGTFYEWAGQLLWVEMSLKPGAINVTEKDGERYQEWYYIPADDIYTLLEGAMQKNLINNYEILEVENDKK